MKFIQTLVKLWFNVSYLNKKKITFQRFREICDTIERYDLTPKQADDACALERLVRLSKEYNKNHSSLKLTIETVRLPAPKA